MFFQDRERETEDLERLWQSGRPELVVLYGRRRVGKTELLRHFVAGKPHLYLVGDLRSERDQLADVTDRLHAYRGDPFLAGQPLASWNTALRYILSLAKEQRLAVILDEFQYFCQASPSLPSVLQSAWDEMAQNSRIFLVLCGSYVSFMEHEVLAHKSPLYGRRTGQIHLRAMDYADAALFLPDLEPPERIIAYAIVGGMPGYLIRLDPQTGLIDNLRQQFFNPAAFLFSEARFLLMEELREPRNYFSVLRAIALGKTRLNEIAQEAGLPTRAVSWYLDVLQGMELVDRLLPVTVRRPERSRQGIYRITDNYLAFWFRFVMPNHSYVDEGRGDWALTERVLPALPDYVGPRFEEVCRQFLSKYRGSGIVPVEFDTVGGWWSSTDEIDVVAIREEGVVLVGECKWTNEWMKLGDLNRLRQRAAGLSLADDVRYALFSRSGFDPNLTAAAKADGTMLYTPKDMYPQDAMARPG